MGILSTVNLLGCSIKMHCGVISTLEGQAIDAVSTYIESVLNENAFVVVLIADLMWCHSAL